MGNRGYEEAVELRVLEDPNVSSRNEVLKRIPNSKDITCENQTNCPGEGQESGEYEVKFCCVIAYSLCLRTTNRLNISPDDGITSSDEKIPNRMMFIDS